MLVTATLSGIIIIIIMQRLTCHVSVIRMTNGRRNVTDIDKIFTTHIEMDTAKHTHHHLQSATSTNFRGSTATPPQNLGEQPLTLLPLFRRP